MNTWSIKHKIFNPENCVLCLHSSCPYSDFLTSVFLSYVSSFILFFVSSSSDFILTPDF